MDLGFGSSNQALGTAAASALLQSAERQERAIEGELSRFDAVLDDAAALEQLRLRRRAELQKRQQRIRECRELGHGSYGDVGGSDNTNDVAKEFFNICKKSPRVVVHFYRPTTRLCDVFHRHLKVLAERHWETRFVSINVESCESGTRTESTSANSGAAFLVERLGIVVMPTLLVVRDRQSVHQLRGFDELGNTPDFSTNVLEAVLARHGAVDLSESSMPEHGEGHDGDDEVDEASPRGVRSIRGSMTRHPFGKGHRPSRRRSDNDDDDDEEDF